MRVYLFAAMLSLSRGSVSRIKAVAKSEEAKEREGEVETMLLRMKCDINTVFTRFLCLSTFQRFHERWNIMTGVSLRCSANDNQDAYETEPNLSRRTGMRGPEA